MENRATDHVLGCFDLPGFDGIPQSGRMLYKNASHKELGGINVSCGTASHVCHEGMGYNNWNSKFEPGASFHKRTSHSLFLPSAP